MLKAVKGALLLVGTVFGVMFGLALESEVHTSISRIHFYHPDILFAVLGGSFGYLVGSTLAWEIERLIERLHRAFQLKTFTAGLTGAGAGLVLANLFCVPIYIFVGSQPFHDKVTSSDLLKAVYPAIAFLLPITVNFVLACLGAGFFIERREDFFNFTKGEKTGGRQAVNVLDTSVIIDGRIISIFQTRFLDGNFVVPKIVLHELQALSDSADPLKRGRGKLGLSQLERFRELAGKRVTFPEIHIKSSANVDEMLVEYAQSTGATLLTMDDNLNKIASVQGLRVLNINELAEAVQSVLLPGEQVEVSVVKRGREPGQGVGYLPNGTMVVIENGQKSMGRKKRVTIQSVLQTSAGRMVFARID